MKKILLLAVLLICPVMAFSDYADDALASLKAQVEPMQQGFANAISTGMAPHMGFFTGSGNVLCVNESSFLGLKAGIGVGMTINDVWMKIIVDKKTDTLIPYDASNPVTSLYGTMGNVIGLLPLPYDQAYLKIGVPVIPLDLGIRVGTIPYLSYTVDGSTSLGFGTTHVGVAARWKFLDLPVFKTDLRLDLDYSSGKIDTSFSQSSNISSNASLYGYTFNVSADAKYTLGANYSWSGLSIGPKILANIDLLILNIYAGAGLNFNIGQTTTDVSSLITIAPTAASEISFEKKEASMKGTSVVWYNPVDVRLMVGFQLLVSTVAVEYGPITGDWAVNVIPLSLAF